jgi:hypothetical protein
MAACAALAVFFVLWASASPAAHDIPNDVTVQTFLKPDGQRLRLLVRVPLSAMRDMDFPKPAGAANADLLDLARAERSLRDAATLWVSGFIQLYENDQPLGDPQVASVRASLQSDKSFASYEEALAHVTGPPLPDRTEFFWSQGLLDVLFEYPIQSDRSLFSIRPSLARLGIRTLTVLRFLPPGGAVRGFEFYGDPGLVRLDPRWHQAAFQFVKLGFFHILDGINHLLFRACLVIPVRRVRSLVAVVTSFTVAHSITLIASAYNLAPDALWFPPLVETLIAVSILYMALENIVFATAGTPGSGGALIGRPPGQGGLGGLALKRRWLVTFGFGLVHGFGFSFRAAPDAAVRRLAPADLAAVVQSRRRARAAAGPRAARARAWPAVPLRRLRGDGDDHPVGARRAHGVALDDRALDGAAPVPLRVAGHRRRVPRGRHALDDAAGRRGGVVLAGVRRAAHRQASGRRPRRGLDEGSAQRA